MTPAIDNRKAARQLAVPLGICEPVSIASQDYSQTFVDENGNTLEVADDLNVTSICSNHSKTIMRANSAVSTASTINDALLQMTPYNVPATVPSTDSDLQLESLDLNSYESFTVSPLTPAISPGVSSIDQPIVPRFLEKRNSDAIPFDELDTNVRLPDFPASTTEPTIVIPDATETVADETVTNLGTVASAYEDDDTITSATSSYYSSIGTDDTTYMEEQAGYLSQFADAAMFGDVTLFTSLVNEIIDSAKHAAKLVVTEKGDPIDDQGPIKIGDNYYTHHEAIRKWKKARDKIKESKYQDNNKKLQRKLEKAAMDAAQLMAATKTFDLAARRSGHHMEKKENKQAVKKALAKMDKVGELDQEEIKTLRSLGGASTWEREELENIRSREVEKLKKKEAESDPSSLSIHELVNSFSLFGFPMGDAEEPLETVNKDSDPKPSNAAPKKTRFDFLNESMGEEDSLKKQKFQFLTKSTEEEEEEPFDCIGESNGNNDSNTGEDSTGISPLLDENNTSTPQEDVDLLDVFHDERSQSDENEESDELELALLDPIHWASPSSSSVHSRSVTNPSPATALSCTSSVANMTHVTNSSSVTEWAGCGVKNMGEMEPFVSTNQSDLFSTSSSLEDLGSAKGNNAEFVDDQPETVISTGVAQQDLDCNEDVEMEQPETKWQTDDVASDDTTASSTKDNSSAASNESSEVPDHGVEVESLYSGDQSGVLSGESGIFSGDSTYTGTTASVSLNSSSQSRALTSMSSKKVRHNGLDSQPATILEEAVCFLLEACQGDMSECPSANSKYTLDSVIGSEYGTEIIFNKPSVSNNPQVPVHQPERVVKERKPRISSKQNKSVVVVSPSPTKKTKSSSPSKGKMLNPLKLITKSQTKKSSPKKSSKPLVVSRQTTPTQEVSDSTSALATPDAGYALARPSSVRPSTPKGLKMGFGVMRSRSEG